MQFDYGYSWEEDFMLRRISKESGPIRLLIATGLFLFGIAVVSLAVIRPHQAAADAPLIVYLESVDTPPALRLNIAPESLTAERVAVVADSAQFQSLVAEAKPQAIMINEVALASVPMVWLRAQYVSGVTIVGINSTRRSLATHLGMSGDGVSATGTSGPVRPPWKGSPAEEAALDWRHPTMPTVVIYVQASGSFLAPDGKTRVTGQHVGSYNDAYDPQHPDALFFLIREVARPMESQQHP